MFILCFSHAVSKIDNDAGTEYAGKKFKIWIATTETGQSALESRASETTAYGSSTLPKFYFAYHKPYPLTDALYVAIQEKK